MFEANDWLIVKAPFAPVSEIPLAIQFSFNVVVESLVHELPVKFHPVGQDLHAVAPDELHVLHVKSHRLQETPAG